MRMPAHHLVADRGDDVVESEMPGFLGHLRMEHHLQQQVAEFVLQFVHVAAIDGIGDLVGFFDRVRRDRREILLQVPGTAAVRIAQLRHDAQQLADFSHAANPSKAIRRRRAR